MKSWKDIAPTWRKILRLVSLIILAAAAAFLFSRCSSEVKKGQQAVNRVNADANLQNQVAAKYLERNPCLTPVVKDSIVTHYDTITTEKKILIPVKLTEYKTKTLDTIIDGISVYVDSTGITVKNLNKQETTTKTVYQTKVDQTRVNNLTDSLNSLRQQYEFKKGQLQAVNDTSNEKSKKIDKLWVIIILISLGAVLSHVLRSYIPSIKLPKL